VRAGATLVSIGFGAEALIVGLRTTGFFVATAFLGSVFLGSAFLGEVTGFFAFFAGVATVLPVVFEEVVFGEGFAEVFDAVGTVQAPRIDSG